MNGSKWKVFILSFLSFEEVLSFVLSAHAVLDGMVGTVVVAGKTRQTGVLVQPLRLVAHSTLDIVYGAYICTNSTFYTAGALNTKGLIAHDMS